MYVHSTDTKIFNKYHFSCRSSGEAAGLYEHYTFYLHLQQKSSDQKKKKKRQQTIITPVKATLSEFKKKRSNTRVFLKNIILLHVYKM